MLSGDPVRLTKCNAIDAQARSRIAAVAVGTVVPTREQIVAYYRGDGGRKMPAELSIAADIGMYGRNRCREMVNRPLPYVTSYNPNTDPDWPN